MSRRTQAERRAGTIAKLVQATIDGLMEHGYGGTTVKVICAGAGVSQGGLFRHFATRLDLVAAAADEVALRQADAFRADLEAMASLPTGRADPIEVAVRAARARCHSAINAVWHELMVACRTDLALREAVEPAAARYQAAIEGLAAEVLAPGLPAERVASAAWFVIHAFDGEAIGRSVMGDPGGVERRILWVAETLRRELAELEAEAG